MLSTSFASLVAALLLVVNGVYTTPIDLVKRASCNKESFMMFRMYAAPVDDPTGERWPVKLIDVKTPSTSIDKLQALTVCPLDSCGQVPAYWELNNRVLSAVYYTETEGITVVNKPVAVNSTVNVVPIDGASTDKGKPEWCAVRSPGFADGQPGWLSVKGSAEDFSWCADIPPNVRTVRRDIYYKPASGVPNRYCTKVHLVIESAGIIAEDIPDTEV